MSDQSLAISEDLRDGVLLEVSTTLCRVDINCLNIFRIVCRATKVLMNSRKSAGIRSARFSPFHVLTCHLVALALREGCGG